MQPHPCALNPGDVAQTLPKLVQLVGSGERITNLYAVAFTVFAAGIDHFADKILKTPLQLHWLPSSSGAKSPAAYPHGSVRANFKMSRRR